MAYTGSSQSERRCVGYQSGQWDTVDGFFEKLTNPTWCAVKNVAFSGAAKKRWLASGPSTGDIRRWALLRTTTCPEPRGDAVTVRKAEGLAMRLQGGQLGGRFIRAIYPARPSSPYFFIL